MAQALARRRARTITALGAVAGGVALTTAAVAGWQAWLGTGPLVGLAVLPVTGVALAAQLVVHRGERLAASIGTLAGMLLVAALDGMQAASAVGLSLAIAIPAGAAGVVLRRYARGRFSLTTLRDLAVLTLVAALVAVTGAALAWAAVAIDTSIVDPWATLARYTLAETLGVLVVVPAVLAWLTPARMRRHTGEQLEAAALAAAVLGGGLAAFRSTDAAVTALVLLPLLWGAIRFGLRGAATSAFAIVAVAEWSTARGHGPFSVVTPSTHAVLELQVLTSVVLLSVLALALALTERDAAEAREWTATERLRRTFDAAPIGMAIATLEGKLIEVNRAFSTMLGSRDDELVGVYLRDLKDRLADDASARSWPTGSEVVDSREQQWSSAQGEPVWVELYEARFREVDGKPEHKIVMAEDITPRKELQRQLVQAQKMEAVGRLAGGIAHDFNNVLAVMRGQVELLQEDLAIVDQARARIESVQRATRRAAALTDDLMSFSRRRTDSPEVIDLNEVVRSLEELLQQVVSDDITLELALDATETAILADPNRIDQAVLNLVVNARDAMPRGGRITVATRNVEREFPGSRHDELTRTTITLTVADTGHGMDAETRRQVFEPFFTTKPDGMGTGLGLSTTHDIVKSSNGTIDVESALGEGTTFLLTFPVVDRELPEAAPEPWTDGQPALDSPDVRRAPDTLVRPDGAPTVLVVDDEPDVRALVAEVLRASGYEVLTAEDGVAALELMADRPPVDLLVTDVLMPRLGGPELADEMTQRDPGTRVLFVSGDAVLDQGRERLRGARLLSKPLGRAELLDAVHAALVGAR